MRIMAVHWEEIVPRLIEESGVPRLKQSDEGLQKSEVNHEQTQNLHLGTDFRTHYG